MPKYIKENERELDVNIGRSPPDTKSNWLVIVVNGG